MPADVASIALLKRQRNKIIQTFEINKYRWLLCASLNFPRGGKSALVTRMLGKNPPAFRFQSVS